jgi:hypothetical protein
MTAKQDVLAVLLGHKPARVPWTIHSGLLHPGTLEREMRNAGMRIAEKSVSAYLSVAPNVLIEERQTWEGNTKTFFITHCTPVGELHSRKIIGPDGSTWTQEYPVKNADDLRALEFITNDTAYYPNYAAITAAQKHLGEDGIVVSRMLRSPLQRLLIEWMGIEGVAFAFADFPDEMERILRCMTAADEMALQITAQSPAEIVWSAENITATITTPKLFARYCLPYYNYCAATLHARHKWYGVHMDGQLAALKNAVAQTDLDFVEAFTPPPMGDFHLVEAQSAWRDKVIWANFPGSVFHSSDQAVVEYALNLLETGLTGGRFMLTFAEDIPDMERSLRLVAQAIARYEEQHR